MRNTVYNVTIQNSFGGAGSSSGFIDNKKVEQYMAANSTTTTLDQGVDKERGNYRFQSVVQNLQLMGNIWVANTNAVGGTATTAPTSFTMTLTVEAGDDVLYTNDELNNGAVLTGNAAIKRSIARAMVSYRNGYNTEVSDQTKTTGYRDGSTANATVRTGSRIMQIDVGALTNSVTTAEAAITVVRPPQ